MKGRLFPLGVLTLALLLALVSSTAANPPAQGPGQRATMAPAVPNLLSY